MPIPWSPLSFSYDVRVFSKNKKNQAKRPGAAHRTGGKRQRMWDSALTRNMVQDREAGTVTPTRHSENSVSAVSSALHLSTG